ncbi:MAG: hypothetical protein JW889_14835, partial [Verrucomicrobia bacterium]|nr:hypothetical protein [Verrucomicrobiota bacterium]
MPRPALHPSNLPVVARRIAEVFPPLEPDLLFRRIDANDAGGRVDEAVRARRAPRLGARDVRESRPAKNPEGILAAMFEKEVAAFAQAVVEGLAADPEETGGLPRVAVVVRLLATSQVKARRP